jgi:hypothetical protein
LPQEQFADDFYKGTIRISTLAGCRNTEDAVRGDAGEGTLQYVGGDVRGP